MPREEFRTQSAEQVERYELTQSEHIRKVHNEMEAMREELKQAMVDFEDRIGKTEQQTLWKIRDVETLLETRISDQKVQDMVSKVEQELKKKIELDDTKVNSRLD